MTAKRGASLVARALLVAWVGACSSTPGSRDAGGVAGGGGSAGVAGADASAGASGSSGDSGAADAGRGSTDAGGPEQVPPPIHVGDCSNLPVARQWENVSPPTSNYLATYVGINAIAIRPDDPSVVFVGADSAGIFRSDDCGSHWTLANTGMNAAAINTGRAWSLALDPVAPDVMYSAQGYGMSGLWKTTDAGRDWAQVFTQNVLDTFSDAGQITSVALDPTDHTHLVAESHGNGMGECAGATCFAESTDSGATWAVKKLANDWSENSGVVLISRKVWLYTGLFGGLWATTDQGATWKKLSDAYATANYYQPHIWQDTAGAYYLPTFNPGILKSAPNDPLTWTPIPGSPNATVLFATGKNLVVGSEFDPKFFIAAQTDASTWTAFPAPAHPPNSQNGAGTFMNYDPAHHILYSADLNQGLWRVVVE